MYRESDNIRMSCKCRFVIMKQGFLDKLREVVNDMEQILVASMSLWSCPNILQPMPMMMVRSYLGFMQHYYSDHICISSSYDRVCGH